MAKFRKKPIVVEAVQHHGEEFCIQTLEGPMLARDGDWIVTGIMGERYPVKPAIFEKTYEPVDDTD